MFENNYAYDKLVQSASKNGISISRLKNILVEEPGKYNSSDFQFLEKYLAKIFSEETRLMSLRVLCRFGNKISSYRSVLNECSLRIAVEFIKIAEKQADPETIVEVVSLFPSLTNMAVLTLKKMGNEEYLTSFLLTGEEDLVKLIQDMESN